MDIIHYKLIFKTIIFFFNSVQKNPYLKYNSSLFSNIYSKGQIVYKFLDFKTLKAPGPYKKLHIQHTNTLTPIYNKLECCRLCNLCKMGMV